MKIDIQELENNNVPYDLLYLADESDVQISKYKDSAKFWGATVNQNIVGILGLKEISKDSTEIVNVAVYEKYQNMKIGATLIERAIAHSRENNYKEIIVKTGNCGIGQLYLYQKCGFRFDSINKDYLSENYPDPIYENNIQCRDQIVLKQEL